MNEKPITAQQAAAFLQISPRLVYRLIESGQLAGKKVGSRYRTTDAACIAYLHSPGETKQASAGDHKGGFLCRSPSEVEYGTVISLHRQEKELDALLTRRTKNKRRSCMTS